MNGKVTRLGALAMAACLLLASAGCNGPEAGYDARRGENHRSVCVSRAEQAQWEHLQNGMGQAVSLSEEDAALRKPSMGWKRNTSTCRPMS